MKLLDASGRDYILVETVGVGQTELDVMGATDTVLVALVPEAGDVVQVMKAGLMEIADIFVVNKADREGAPRMQTELTLMLELKYSAKHPEPGDPPLWKIPVLQAQAVNNIGMTELFQAIEDHHRFLQDTGELDRKRKTRRREELLSRVEYEARRRLTTRAQTDPTLAQLLDDVSEGKIDAYSASLQILSSEIFKSVS